MNYLIVLFISFILAGCSSVNHVSDSDSHWIVKRKGGFETLYWCTIKPMKNADPNGPTCYEAEMMKRSGSYVAVPENWEASKSKAPVAK